MEELNLGPVTVQEELDALLDDFRKAVEGSFPSQLAGMLADDIHASAGKQDYSAVRSVVESHLRSLDSLNAGLKDILNRLEYLEKKRLQREKYSQPWWEQVRKKLRAGLADNPSAAFCQWAALYAQALLEWRLEACQKLVNENFSFPSRLTPYVHLFRFGTEALLKGEYGKLVELLDFLTAPAMPDLQQAISDQTRAQLHVFCSRIHLYTGKDFEKALQQLEKAAALAPSDGRVQAAWGHYYHLLKADKKPNPGDYFQEAIRLMPNEPDGYVGMGLLAEESASWDIAADWYLRAVDSVTDEPDMQTHLEKLLQPVSGNLFLALARYLFREKNLPASHKAIDKAIDIELKDSTDYPNRVAYALKGNILEAESQQEGAPTPELARQSSEAYAIAGRYYYWLADYQPSIDLFRNSIRLDPQAVTSYWYLADTLRVLSASDKKPYVLPEQIYAALEVWEQSEKIQVPGTEQESWAFHARSRIATNLSSVPREDREERMWEALGYMERAIIYSATAARWSDLSQSYRNLNLYRSALDAAQRAMRANEDDLKVLEDNAAILINLGEYDQAEPLLNKLIEKSQPEWTDFYYGWQAVVDFYKGRSKDALKNIRAYIRRFPDDIWGRHWRSEIYRQLGNHEKARKEDEWIWKRRNDPDYSGEDSTFAWVAFSLDLWEEAVNLAMKLRSSRIYKGSSYFIPGLVALVHGDFAQAESNIIARLDLSETRDSVANVRREVLAVEARAARLGDPNLAALREFLYEGGFLSKIDAKAVELEQKDTSPFAELREALAGIESCQPGNWCWTALEAGLGRLLQEQEQWPEALETYLQLKQSAEKFPEASIGIQKSVNSILKKGDELFAQGEYRAAHAQYGLIAPVTREGEHTGRPQARLVLTSLLMEDEPAAFSLWTELVGLLQEKRLVSPGMEIGQTWLSLNPSPPVFWRLWDWLTARLADNSLDERARQALQDARDAVRPGLENAYRLNVVNSYSIIPVVTPIVLEVGDDLVPVVDSRQDEGRFLYQEIPAMRERIKNDLGISVPGVRARGIAAGQHADRFLIQLDEVQVFEGAVKMGKHFCRADQAQVDELGIEPSSRWNAPDPWNAGGGFWIPYDQAELARAAGLEVWEEPMYIIHHLEATLRRHAANFLAIDDVEKILKDWADGKNQKLQAQPANDKPASSAPEIARMLKEQKDRIFFARLLRALVKEAVPVTNISMILDAIQGVPFEPENFAEALRQARLALRSCLPGNSKTARRVPLSPEWEAQLVGWVNAAGEGPGSMLPPQQVHELIREIDGLLPEPDQRSTLVVRHPQVRPYLRRLLEVRFPDTQVLSEEEVLEPLGVAESMG